MFDLISCCTVACRLFLTEWIKRNKSNTINTECTVACCPFLNKRRMECLRPSLRDKCKISTRLTAAFCCSTSAAPTSVRSFSTGKYGLDGSLSRSHLLLQYIRSTDNDAALLFWNAPVLKPFTSHTAELRDTRCVFLSHPLSFENMSDLVLSWAGAVCLQYCLIVDLDPRNILYDSRVGSENRV